MPDFDLYGFAEPDLSAVRSAVEEALGVQFIRRENPHLGGEYFGTQPGPGNEHFVLRRNLDPADRKAAEQEFPDYPAILYVNCTTRSDAIRAKLESLAVPGKLLRHGPMRKG